MKMKLRKFPAAFWLVALAVGINSAEHVKKASPGVQPLPDPPGVHNLFALGANVFSGGTPEGEEGFAALDKLGIKTIISVDGSKPDVDLAKKHGMRYVHLPHGYDGISANIQLQLAKAALVLPGPLYVHCHHGEHRGPAAAAIVCMSKESWSPAQAEAWLKVAGTSTNYQGLYEAVRHFKRPSAAALKAAPSDFPETATVSGLVDAMVGIDQRWDMLKAIRAAGYGSLEGHPDIAPANEAVILRESFREAQRIPAAVSHGADFLRHLAATETKAAEAEELLRSFASERRPETQAQLDRSFDAIGKSCSSCHRSFRDRAEISAAR